MNLMGYCTMRHNLLLKADSLLAIKIAIWLLIALGNPSVTQAAGGYFDYPLTYRVVESYIRMFDAGEY